MLDVFFLMEGAMPQELDTAFPWQPALKGFARTQDSQSERLEN